MKLTEAVCIMQAWTIIGMLFCPAQAAAEVELPKIFSDNMVLQRNTQVAVWGWATPGQVVAIEFAGQMKTVTANSRDIPPESTEGAFLLDGRRKRWALSDFYPRSSDGKPMARWIIHLDPMQASAEGRTLTIRTRGSNRKTEIHNVVVGEVWFAAGQSNMSWGIKQRIKNRELALRLADNPLIRLTKPGYGGCQETRYGTQSTWDICSSETIENHSAIPFFFAECLQQELRVPVGIITAATGGALIESFTDLPTLKKDPDFPKYDAMLKTWSQSPGIRRQPTAMYYAMVEPVIPFSIKGAIWYQGENSIGDDYYYRDKLAAMITAWRAKWECGDFSFYVAQLAGGPPAKSPDKDPYGHQPSFGWPDFRESQLAVVDVVSNCDVANLIDIGESSNVHGYNKRAQGERLARLALAHDYGQDVVYSGPRYKSHRLDGVKYIVTFDHVGQGLTAAKLTAVPCNPPYVSRDKVASKEWVVEIDERNEEELSGFHILAYDESIEKPDVHWCWPKSGVNKIVAPKVKIVGKDAIEVWSDEITDPKQIVGLRYNWGYQLKGNLYNLDGFPTFPFRTDSIKSGQHLQIDIRRGK